jgi:hypothetical protein
MNEATAAINMPATIWGLSFFSAGNASSITNSELTDIVQIGILESVAASAIRVDLNIIKQRC